MSYVNLWTDGINNARGIFLRWKPERTNGICLDRRYSAVCGSCVVQEYTLSNYCHCLTVLGKENSVFTFCNKSSVYSNILRNSKVMTFPGSCHILWKMQHLRETCEAPAILTLSYNYRRFGMRCGLLWKYGLDLQVLNAGNMYPTCFDVWSMGTYLHLSAGQELRIVDEEAFGSREECPD